MQKQPSHSQTGWKLKESMSHILKIFWHSVAEWPICPGGHKDTSVSDVSAPECVQVNHLSNTCRNEHFLSHRGKQSKKEKNEFVR